MPLGTAGPVKKAEKLLGRDEPFLVLNGDLITEINYREFSKAHVEGKAVATIALHEIGRSKQVRRRRTRQLEIA